MKKILTVLFVLLISQIVFAQTKIAESKGYEVGSDKVAKLIEFLKKDTESTGLIIIQNGKSREGLGNILAFEESVKAEIKFRLGKKSVEKISFAIIEGKEPYFNEFWIIPRGKKKPKVKEIQISLNKLMTKYYYASMCSNCSKYSPVINSNRIDFIPFAQALKKTPNYRGLIVVHTTLITSGNRVRDDLVREFDLSYEQIDVALGEKFELPHPVYDFYLVPKSTKIKKQ